MDYYKVLWKDKAGSTFAGHSTAEKREMTYHWSETVTVYYWSCQVKTSGVFFQTSLETGALVKLIAAYYVPVATEGFLQ